MSCHRSLEILDAIRPDSDDFLEPEFREAYAHMQECPECSDIWESRQNQDRSLGRVMLDVPVPETLRHRLEEALEITLGESQAELNENEIPSGHNVPVRSHNSRRRLFLKTAAALSTALLLTFAAWLFWKPQPTEPLSLEELVNATPLNVEEFEKLSEFDDSFTLNFPKIWKKSKKIEFHLPAKGFSLHGRNKDSNKHIAALLRFNVKDQFGNNIVGYLLAIPKNELANAPDLTDFDPQQNAYVERTNGLVFDSVAWSQGDLTYVAFIPAGHKGLDAIQKALSPHGLT